MPLCRNCLALGVFGIMALAGSARADSAGEQDEPLSPAITRIMDRPQYANARWGLLQVDAASGRVRQSLRGAEMFLPGSSAKLFSVSAVWKILGPDTRFTTPVHFLGSRKGGRVEGDLVLVGSGDLTLGGRTKPDGSVDWTNTDHGDANAIPGATLTAEDPLAGIKELARQVRASGITEVQGNVVIDDRLFTSSFEPQPTPVMINDNLIDIVTTPTEPGSPAEVTFRPLSASYVVDATVKTVAVGQPTAITIVGSAPGTITVTGTIAAGSATLVRVAPINDPAAFARTAFIEALRTASVQIDVAASGENPKKLLPPSSSYPDSSRVAAYVSPPYSEYAKLILKVSHNLGANLGLCLLAVHAKSADGNAGFALLKDFLTAAKVDVAQLAMSDAEGGPTDRATPQTFAQILRYWTRQKDFDAFRACLPILGTDGSLSSVAVDSPARGKVFAKTGTNVGFDPLGQRLLVQSKALAGFFQRADGEWQVFNVVVNDAGGAPDITAALSANEDVGEVAAQLWKEANPAGR